MKKDSKEKFNELIIQFLNRWLKTGRKVEGRDSFFARADLEKFISEAYLQGRKDVVEEIEFENALKRSL